MSMEICTGRNSEGNDPETTQSLTIKNKLLLDILEKHSPDDLLRSGNHMAHILSDIANAMETASYLECPSRALKMAVKNWEAAKCQIGRLQK